MTRRGAKNIALGDQAAEQLLLRTVELDKAISHPDLASDCAMLEQVWQGRRGRGADLGGADGSLRCSAA